MPQGSPIELDPPLGGVRGDVVPYKIPPGYLWRSQNVVDRYGKLRTRPGLQAPTTTGPTGGRLSGGMFFKTVVGNPRTVAATLTKWSQLVGNGWTDISGGFSFTNDVDNPARFAVFPSAGINWLIGVNNTDIPKKWDGTSGALVSVGGTPPIAKDVTVCGNFVVLGNVVEGGIRSTSRIRVSDFNNLDLWAQYGPADLADTNDDIIAVRALTRTSFAIYKDKSIWMAWAELGLFPFRLEAMEIQSGPASPSAVVRVGQEHYYLGTDSRIYKFNGFTADIVSRPIEVFLQNAALATYFSAVFRSRCFGVFNYFDRNVWFYYPGPTGPDPVLAISYNVDTRALYLHGYGLTLSAAWEGDDLSTLTWNDLTGSWNNIGPGTYHTWDDFGGTLRNTVFIGSVGGQVYRQVYDVGDAGAAISANLEFPLKPWFGLANNTHVEAVEGFFEQTLAGGPIVTVQVGVSTAFSETMDPPYTTLGTHDTTLATRQKVGLPTLDARFWSIKYAWSSATPVKFGGGLASGFPQPVPESGP